jgi:hypothetical protein
MNRRRGISRRAVLRGAGVALGLPWLESLVPRAARGQILQPDRTFIAMSFPCGVAPLYWKPAATGPGDAWALSPILQPLAPVKGYVNVLSNVGNYGPFGGHVEPTTGNLTAALLTATRPTVSADHGSATCGISVDQVIAKGGVRGSPLDSLQVGLSTLDSSTNGLPPECSRSISWRSATEPTYKLIDPQAVFDKIVSGGNLPANDPVNAARRAKGKSVLDYVLAHATSVRAKVSASDRQHMDDFMTSVRTLELNTQGMAAPAGCGLVARPPESFAVGNVPADYDRDTHANLMIDLVVMALQCGVTRVVSFMLDDARSDFVYGFLPVRHFTTAGSTPATGTCAGLYGLINAGYNNDGLATVNMWFVDKLSRLAQKLLASPSGAGNLLDDATIWFGSEMHGGNQDALDLPILTVGKAGGSLKTNQAIDFATTARKSERLANLHLTFIRSVFEVGLGGPDPITTFGTAVPPVGGGPLTGDFGAGTDVIPEILA